jgi:DNA-binding transcriptional LysR family regulator
MELRQLRTFELLARTGSFTGVARELSISQPAVSAQIQALEQELGLRLLDRLPRGVRLTAAGEVLLGYARRMLNLEAEAAAAMLEQRGAQATYLRLAASPTIGAYLLPQLLGQFKRLHPEMRSIADIEPSSRVVEALQSYAVEIGLVEAPVEETDLVVAEFLSDELVLVVPAGHPLAGHGPISVSELQAWPMVSREPESGTRALVEEALSALGVRLAPAYELGGVEAIKNAVLMGLGVAFMSRQAIGLEERAGLLVPVAVEGLSLRRPLYYLHQRHHHLSALARSFIRLLDGLAGAEAGGARKPTA